MNPWPSGVPPVASQRLPVAVDDVAALGDQGGHAKLAPGVIAECREVQDPRRDQPDHPDIDQHPEHQSLVNYREELAPLADQVEPLGPGDESGRRGVHCGVPVSLVLVRADAASARAARRSRRASRSSG